MDKKFRISSNKLESAGAAFVLCLFLISYLFMKVTSDFEENPLKYVLISAGIGIVLAVVCIIFVKENYIQILDDGFEISKGSKVTKYAFSDFAGSKVTKNYTNGIYTGTTRELKIMGKDGKTFSLNAGKLSEKEFAELINYLGKSEFKETHDIEAVEKYFDEKKGFAIPRETIINANKKKAVLWGVSLIVSAILCLVFSLAYLANESAIIMVVAIVFGLYIPVFGYLEFYPAFSASRKVKSIPSAVVIESWGITVDSDIFKAENITNISMVPSSYKEILSRDFIITTKDGNTRKYNFGPCKKDAKATYAEYDQLYTTIKMWCIAKNISFMSILG